MIKTYVTLKMNCVHSVYSSKLRIAVRIKKDKWKLQQVIDNILVVRGLHLRTYRLGHSGLGEVAPTQNGRSLRSLRQRLDAESRCSSILKGQLLHVSAIVTAYTLSNEGFGMSYSHVTVARRHSLSKAPYLCQTLEELSLGTYASEVHVIRTDTTVIAALHLFLRHQISCLPVIDEHGRLTDLYSKFDVFSTAIRMRHQAVERDESQQVSFKDGAYQAKLIETRSTYARQPSTKESRVYSFKLVLAKISRRAYRDLARSMHVATGYGDWNLAVTRSYNRLDITVYDALAFHRSNRQIIPRIYTRMITVHPFGETQNPWAYFDPLNHLRHMTETYSFSVLEKKNMSSNASSHFMDVWLQLYCQMKATILYACSLTLDVAQCLRRELTDRKSVVRIRHLNLHHSGLGLGNLAVSQPSCFPRVSSQPGIARVLQLDRRHHHRSHRLNSFDILIL
ncbi:5'-AMP-activated protein kinase regulatory gamma subunit [Clonorchis sinensis]|uniref:5'-AMP-activated protein kinase regulatory gamma subunit n=1 Tax=Clonorchis sinensis TaxID=79923 RepID=G7YRU4_CLOSI|nr:5'-AMP-activated protein kinase regulatory gamma subunit [Clonorchis sinensis]